jgi:Tfp pilus assembly protein FimV
VENQPLTAPEVSSPKGQEKGEPQDVTPAVPEEPLPSAPPEAPEPEPAQPAATPPERHDQAVSLAGRRVHVVQVGECLWSIAEALLPAGAGNAEIAAEVQRLWSLNAARIGTGDPNVLYPGTALRLS